MTNLHKTVLLLAFAGACARNTGEAGVKPIGVGYDPGDLFAAPEERGGIIDVALVQMRGTNLDLGITGFFGTGDAFTDVNSDPFDSVLGFSYFFAPAISGADEYSLVSPKGPDVPETCMVQISTGGPLGSFDTVDVGEDLFFTNNAETSTERTSFAMPRNPQDYPSTTSDVFIYYIGTEPLRWLDQAADRPSNWAYGQPISMHFDGGIPPEDAPVPAIPYASDVADDRVGKEAGDPVIDSPSKLSGVAVSNRLDGEDSVVMVYSPATPGLPAPTRNDKVVRVTWDPPEGDSPSTVSIAIKLMRPAVDGTVPENADRCLPSEALEPGAAGRDIGWLTDYTRAKGAWCDADFEPDVMVGNDELGDDYLSGVDTCHDGIDAEGDGTCDEGGCWDGEIWLASDPDCARHVYETSSCSSDGLCRPVGGDRGGDGAMGQVICSAEDDGDFTVDAAQIEALLAAVDITEIDGAVLIVSRTTETLVQVPAARDQLGNVKNINPIRLRASQVQFGRLDW